MQKLPRTARTHLHNWCQGSKAEAKGATAWWAWLFPPSSDPFRVGYLIVAHTSSKSTYPNVRLNREHPTRFYTVRPFHCCLACAWLNRCAHCGRISMLFSISLRNHLPTKPLESAVLNNQFIFWKTNLENSSKFFRSQTPAVSMAFTSGPTLLIRDSYLQGTKSHTNLHEHGGRVLLFKRWVHQRKQGGRTARFHKRLDVGLSHLFWALWYLLISLKIDFLCFCTSLMENGNPTPTFHTLWLSCLTEASRGIHIPVLNSQERKSNELT